jgi:subtilisin-like proprotein convertase family protein
MPLSSGSVSDLSGTLTILDNATVSRSIFLGTTSWYRVTNLRVTLTNLSHNFPDDLDFLLVGPDGRNLEFWSDAGGTADLVNASFVISDSAASSLPDNTAIAAGTYKPTDYTGSEAVETSSNWSGLPGITINHPGPTGSATFAPAFAGAWLSNTTWTLDVRDDDPASVGSLASWSITFDFRILTKPHDFDGSDVSDILWQNNDGTPGIWTMSGFTAVSVGPAGPNAPWPYNPGPSWHVKGDADFNDDFRSDILWQNNDGTAGIWLMNGLTATAISAVGTNPGPAWHIKDANDFNFDGKADILWQNDDGTAGIWLMNGFTVLASGAVGTNPGASWQVKGAGDFNNDGKADILWQNVDGTAGIWLMDGLTVLNQGPVGTNPGPSWQVKGSGDFNDDGRADILWQNTDGTAGIWLMDGLTVLNQGPVGTNPGPSWHIMGSGTYNGDSKSDILWQCDDGRPGIWIMNGLSVLTAGVAGSFNPGADWHVIA